MNEILAARADRVEVSEDELTVHLVDGRTITAPLAWYPRLFHGTAQERNRWRLTAKGEGIHWMDLDEDVSVANLLMGNPSGESQRSFRAWLESRGGHGKGVRKSGSRRGR